MSLSLIQVPEYITPVNNPVPIVFDSSFATENGFRYKVTLTDGYGNDSDIWIYPDTDNNNYCIYDFSMILSDSIGSNKDNYNVTKIESADESILHYWFRVTEYIGSTSGDTYFDTDMRTVFRGVKQYGDFWDMDDYTMTGSTGQFLSEKSSRKYKLSEYGSINALKGPFGSNNSNWDTVVLDLYNGSYLNRYSFNEFPSSYTLPNIFTIPIGPVQINQMSNAGLIINSGTTLPVVGDLLDETSIYYDIHLQDGSDVSSETKRIYLDHDCYRWDGVEFLYLGDLSTYETFTARFSKTKSFKTGRSEVKSNYYGINSTQYNYSIGDRGRQNINIQSQETNKVLTGWLNDNQSTDLMELFRSTDVYIIEDGNVYPIIITNTSYVEKKVLTDKLFNYTISYEMSYQKLSNS